MNEATIELIETLADTFKPYGWNERSVGGYLIALRDIPDPVLAAAVDEALRTCDRMPTPSALRRIVFRRFVHEVDPGAAWAEVVTQIARVGYIGQPTFTDPLIDEAVEYCGGWRQLCLSENHTADRARFLDTVIRLVQRRQRLQVNDFGALQSGYPAEIGARDLLALPSPSELDEHDPDGS